MKRILVVDDNTEFLQTLTTVLSDDFDTIKATGVMDALNTLQIIAVDAICSDFNMRKMAQGWICLKQFVKKV